MSDFVKHLEKASKTVLGWPEWKRNILGGGGRREAGVSANVYYSSHVALGLAWHTTATFYRLHVTILLPWMSVQIGLLKRPNIKVRRLYE